ncbi:hypothetical protein AZK46_15660 [Acinetobacter baumannii]|nr:hypothetical protein AZK46_15660 [Acinetobacter baumannii]
MAMEIAQLLVALVMAHFLCDFALQNDFVANFKARFVGDQKNDMWGWVLSSHCAIHALPVFLLTKSLGLSLLMFVTHFVIDLMKCEKKISFNLDQSLHLTVVFLITGLYALS